MTDHLAYSEPRADAARDAGLRSIERNSQTFIETMRSLARCISLRQGSVTCDDLRRVAAERGIEPAHQNAWGAIFRGKEWVCVGRKKSLKISNHSREIRVWRYKGTK